MESSKNSFSIPLRYNNEYYKRITINPQNIKIKKKKINLLSIIGNSTLASITHYYAVSNIDSIQQRQFYSNRVVTRTHIRILKFKKPSPLISSDNFQHRFLQTILRLTFKHIETCISDNVLSRYKEFKYEIWSPRSIITSNNAIGYNPSGYLAKFQKKIRGKT